MAGKIETSGRRGVVDVAVVEQEIGARRLGLTFPPAVEAVFQVETSEARVDTTVITALVAVLLYDVFLINDWQILRDQFTHMVEMRLGIFTPTGILLIARAYRTRSAWLAEWGGVMFGALAVALPMIVMVFSHSPDRLSYQFGSLITMMFVTVIQRVRFRQTVVALIVMLTLQLITTYVSDIFTAQTYVANTLFFVTVVLLLLLTSYLLERDDRRVFLLALRGRLLNEQILEGARRDPLTGLFNRNYLTELTGDVWAAARVEPRLVSVIMLDIDHFKMFNDNYGHLKGDDCLCTISAAISTTIVGKEAFAFRFGGEEMLLVLPGADRAESLATAQAIRAAIRACAIPHPVVGQQAVVTASFGIASGFAPAASASDLIAAADAALYGAKHAGRDCIWPHDRVKGTLDFETARRKSA